MRIRRDIAIQSILKHQDSFLKILDHINNNSGVLDIPSSLYLKLYHKDIYLKAESQNDINAHQHLSVESLIENGIFVYHNRHTGNLTLDNTIFELLRFIDVSRARELNREDFENLRGHIEQAVKNVMKYSFGSEQYNDSMMSFHSIMNETLSKFRSNVEKLVKKVEDISVKYKAFESNEKVSFIELYEKVQFLYRRYVLPCYDFISPNLQLVSKQSFSESLDALIDFHHEQGSDAVANQLGFNKTAVTSYFKDVAELENKLKQYSNRLETDRNFFISVESAFTALMNDIDELRHGKKKGFMLSENSPFFLNFKSLDGLSTHKMKFDSGLKWKKEKSIKGFKEYLKGLEDIELTKRSSVSKKIQPLPINIEPDEDRKKDIAEIISEFEPSSFNLDIHQYLNNILKVHLDDFSLVDVLFGLECVYDLYEQEIVMNSYEIHRLSDDKYFLTYLPIKLQETLNV